MREMGRWEDGEIGGEGDKGTRGIITPQSTVNSQQSTDSIPHIQ